MSSARVVAFLAGLVLSMAPAAPQAANKQLVAHRGASAYAPENTLHAYRLAIEQGADFVEQDLAVTRDGVLVCIHDLTLERTTDVEVVFPERFAQEGAGAGDPRRWFVNDFTLAEIKRLDAGSWYGTEFAGARIPTFQEAIDLVRGKAGLYPELKDPAFYRRRGVDTARLLQKMIEENSLAADVKTPVIIQSFDEATLRQLSIELRGVPRVYLLEAEAADKVDSPEKVAAFAAWATGLGPNKAVLLGKPELVAWAHRAGLTVTPWTFRASNTPFPSVREEMAKYLYDYGVDALFTDNPDLFPRLRPSHSGSRPGVSAPAPADSGILAPTRTS